MARALVLDPDTDHARRIARELEALGFAVGTAKSADEALESPASAPDLVVAELRLPDACAFEVIAALASRGATPTAVLFTAAPTYEACREAWDGGAATLLAKPVAAGGLAPFAALARSAGSDRPAGPPAELDRRGAATEEEIRAAVREALAFALLHGASPATRARLGGAVFEVLDNVRAHAYDGRAGEFRLCLRAEHGELVAHVTDRGTGFDTVAARLDEPPAALPVVESEPGGLARAAALTESLSVTSSPACRGDTGGTRVTLRVSVRPAALGDGDASDLSDLDYLDTRTAKRVLRAIARNSSRDLYNIPPSIAVAIGRLLVGPTPAQLAQATLWS